MIAAMATEPLIEDLSPHGSLEAFVEDDGRAVYFYLHGSPESEFGVRSCWVRNLVTAPSTLDVDGMQDGRAPALPADFCRDPNGALHLDRDALRVVWFEEGDGAALLEGDDVLAIIPPWSGDDVKGYARDCIRESVLCWPLLPDNALLDRVRRADEYWSSWGTAASPWKPMQESQLAIYQQELGAYEKYYGIDGNEWPPKALLRIPSSDRVTLVTIGVAIRPQPAVELVSKHPEDLRRFELALAMSPGFASRYFDEVAPYMSAQSNLPWFHITWVGHGHTVPCDAFPKTPFTAVLLLRSGLGVPQIELPPFRGDRVNLFWLIPITNAEHEFAIKQGSNELVQRLESAGVSCVAGPRHSVV